MAFSRHSVPPLSPILVAGIAMKAMPLAVINPLLGKAMQMMVQRHRDVFERLQCLDHVTFVIDPTDLPFVFLLRPNMKGPSLTAVRKGNEGSVTAYIRGSFVTLTKLLEGTVDGDALVFSRDLVIEGDTEAVLALRNAVDGGNIAIKQDLASIFGPLSIVATKAADGVISLVGRANNDMILLQAALNNQLYQLTEEHSAQIEDLENQMDELRKQVKKLKKGS